MQINKSLSVLRTAVQVYDYFLQKCLEDFEKLENEFNDPDDVMGISTHLYRYNCRCMEIASSMHFDLKAMLQFYKEEFKKDLLSMGYEDFKTVVYNPVYKHPNFIQINTNEEYKEKFEETKAYNREMLRINLQGIFYAEISFLDLMRKFSLDVEKGKDEFQEYQLLNKIEKQKG